MAHALTIALAQITLPVGDIAGNERRILHARTQAKDASLVAFPEMSLAGYPPQDLILRPDFLDQCHASMLRLAEATKDGGPALLIGAPWRTDGHAYNAALLLEAGKIEIAALKRDLPNYGVFDEKRVFVPGKLPTSFSFRGHTLGVVICEDIWTLPAVQSIKAADIIIVPNASPFEHGKLERREKVCASAARAVNAPVLYLNAVGAQDELVFDGASFATDAHGNVVRRMKEFEEEIAMVSLPLSSGETRTLSDLERTYCAMKLGLKSYISQNGFTHILLGLSGGIDSALSAAVAVDALGKAHVTGVRLPSKYTSTDSMEDAEETARLLGIKLETVSIEPLVESCRASLAKTAGDPLPELAAENLQSRARGLTLMAISNATGAMLLSTGNKSEMAVGYATLYGDMCGGYNVLKDVYKTEVYALANWRNEQGRAIPERSITKAPTAELRPNQTDQDSLPPYDVLDAILRGLIEEDESAESLIARGFERAVVEKVVGLLYVSEFKRRQSAPGAKVSTRTLGIDRRYPISSKYRR
ncbi:MAG: NAD+ synthase [Alphaproteobacteria bacterium]|nr:NAD+ synthase [Alphaproteobacteria bacterium]